MSTFSNPKLASIDDALSQLEGALEAFARLHRFSLTRSHEGSFNVPRRWLQRRVQGVFEEIGVIVASPMPERLELGFYPEIPCTLYVSSQVNGVLLHHEAVAEAIPFQDMLATLAGQLQSALEALEFHTREHLQA
jgi:hypothetical protein